MQRIPEETLRKARRIGKMLNLLATVAPTQAGRMAFRIFCTPRSGKLRPKDMDFLATAHEQATHHIEQHAIQTYIWQPSKKVDSPPTALFLHGWESNSARWQRFVHAFRDAGFRVMAFDAPAHGGSSGKMLNLIIYSGVVKGFLEKNGAPDVLIGHSIGGAATVMSIAAFGAPRPKKAAVLGVFAESTRVIRDFGHVLGLDEKVLEYAKREVLRRSQMPLEAYSIREKSRLLADLPGLVLHDTDDEVAPFAEGQQVAEAWGAQFIETQGLGHRMQDKEVVRALLRFATEG